MKYAFIQQHRRLWPVSVQFRVLQVSAAGWPRIWRELVARGIAVGKARVQKLM